jgi:hypothetical protein
MPKKPKDQSREEKKWVRKSAYLFLCDACNACNARSEIHIADAQLSVSTVGFNPEPAMVQWNELHFTTATLETFHQRHLGFQMDDIAYCH